MTAYNFSSLTPDSSYPPKWTPGATRRVEFQYTLGGAVVSGDTYTTPANALPSNGIRIIEVTLMSPELDTNAAPTATISAGDATSATRFINAAPAGIAGVTTSGYQLINNINVAQTRTNGVVSAGPNYLYGSGVSPQIVVTLGGTVATAQTTGTIRLVVTYECTEENA